ncbi:MAG: SLBB domain-containing protein [Polyangiaceae bacterium]|nr:SLBB domain-containing protein [Polyangiaceae bacterium]
MALRDHHLLPDAPLASYDAYCRAAGENAVLAARAMGPDAVLAEVHRSGLRGRGGAGFPTGVKWASIAGHPCTTRYVVCNAAEGEPGTFKDRYLLRRNPYATLEGALIAAHLVGAREIYVALKASYVEELGRLRAAASEIAAAGLMSYHEVRFVEGPEEYLFGEEKALLEVIEGNDPLPREAHYPPYERGLFATARSPNPALVNNVETLARVPGIVRGGGESFARLGTRDTPGPLLFTLSGDVTRPGVYELPAGTPLRRLLDEAAGGPRPGRRWKAALSGVSSAVIPAERLDTPADFASLKLIGAGLGSAGFIALDDGASMVRVAQAVARFLYVESCNQCSACKHGLGTASSALDELFDPALATPDDVGRAMHGARSAPQGNRCFLPAQGAILIPSLLSRFSAEVAAQLADPARPSAPYLIPKIVDFDEQTRTFLYDLDQPRKRPNWTYEEPPPPPSAGLAADAPASLPPRAIRPVSMRPASPGRPAGPPAAVLLASDVRDALAAVAEARGESVERVANEALRAWLASSRTRA